MKNFGKIKNVHVMMALFAVLLVSLGYMSMQNREGMDSSMESIIKNSMKEINKKDEDEDEDKKEGYRGRR